MQVRFLVPRAGRVTLSFHAGQTVADAKSALQAAVRGAPSLTLVHGGQILDDGALLSSLGLTGRSFIHARAAGAPPPDLESCLADLTARERAEFGACLREDPADFGAIAQAVCRGDPALVERLMRERWRLAALLSLPAGALYSVAPADGAGCGAAGPARADAAFGAWPLNHCEASGAHWVDAADAASPERKLAGRVAPGGAARAPAHETPAFRRVLAVVKDFQLALHVWREARGDADEALFRWRTTYQSGGRATP
jgi:hypothetical protein